MSYGARAIVGEWWVNNSNINLLKGVEDDETNIPRLSDEYIIDFLLRIPAARASFELLVPNMLEEEQIRLRRLATAAHFMMMDPKDIEDAFQASQNKVGVHTSGRYGGTRMGGNN